MVPAWLDTFRVARFRFALEAKDPLHLPPYKGSVLRGAFGHVFRSVGCVARRGECPPCVLKGACPYSYIFETPPPADTLILRKYPYAPHPFVLEPPLDATTIYEPGSLFTFGLVLIGKGIDYLPYFVYAFDELGRLGLGRGKGKYRLVQVVLVRDPDQVVPIYNGTTGLLTTPQISQLAARAAELMLQIGLEAQVEAVFGRGHYARGARPQPGWRNGYATRTLTTEAGPLTLRPPKVRATATPFRATLPTALAQGTSE